MAYARKVELNNLEVCDDEFLLWVSYLQIA